MSLRKLRQDTQATKVVDLLKDHKWHKNDEIMSLIEIYTSNQFGAVMQRVKRAGYGYEIRREGKHDVWYRMPEILDVPLETIQKIDKEYNVKWYMPDYCYTDVIAKINDTNRGTRIRATITLEIV